MKATRLILVMLVFALVSILPIVAQAQTSAVPTLNNTAYVYRFAVDSSYVASQTDTLPQPTSAGVAVTFRGAFDKAELVLEAADSCTADIYIDRRPIGATSWTVSYTDSSKSAATILPVQTYSLRSHTAENLGGLYYEYRIRLAFRATGNGTVTKYYSLKLIWKP